MWFYKSLNLWTDLDFSEKTYYYNKKDQPNSKFNWSFFIDFLKKYLLNTTHNYRLNFHAI